MNKPTSSLPRFLDTSPKSSPCWRINTETEGGAEKKNDRLEAQRIGISGSCYDKYLSGYDNIDDNLAVETGSHNLWHTTVRNYQGLAEHLAAIGDRWT